MARKLRLEFPGACYHVINRGNYRTAIFRTEGAKQAFEACLFEACEKSAWRLHAFVLMGNHYHLALETPEGTLVAGMQWLQATFANRFNRRRSVHGHLFQGRYKALLVEDGEPLGLVGHYIHLNPVRARIVTCDRLPEFRYSSYWYRNQPIQRPKFLELSTVLRAAGGLTDSPHGWKCYADYLQWQTAEGPAGTSSAYVSMSQGWCLGSAQFKQALLEDHAVAALARAWEESGAREIREARWLAERDRCLNALGIAFSAVTVTLKSAAWKIAIAVHLKTHTQANNRWLANHLHMGTPVSVSQLVGKYRRRPLDHAAVAGLIETLKT